MHVVMLLAAATIMLPHAAEESPCIFDSQGFVEMFNEGVELVIPGSSGCTEHDGDGVFVPPETNGADWKGAIGKGWGLVSAVAQRREDGL